MSATECSSEAPKLNWAPKIYVGDSATKSYVRQAEDGSFEQISCESSDFDTRIILSNKEPEAFQKALNELTAKCASWK